MTTPTDAARELYSFVTNHAPSWKHVEHIARVYERRRDKGTYDAALARKGLLHAMEASARAYVKDHCAPGDAWHAIFKPADRAAAADMIAADMETEWSAGNRWNY